MPPQPISAMPGRSFGLMGGLAVASAAAAICLWMNHKGNPVAAAVAVQEARKDRREIWTDLFMRLIENRKRSMVKLNYQKGTVVMLDSRANSTQHLRVDAVRRTLAGADGEEIIHGNHAHL